MALPVGGSGMHVALPVDRGLSIRALGGFHVSVGPRSIGPENWRLKKAAALFKYLAIKQPAWIPREELLDTFWGDLFPENAERAFRTTVHVLRKVLEPNLPRYAPSAYVEHRDTLYRLRPEAIQWFDVASFEAAVRRFLAARRQSDIPGALSAAREAVDLYGGTLYPEERYQEWAMAYRDLLHQEYLDTVEAFASMTVGSADAATHAEAVQIVRRALQTAPERESLHVLLMKHLDALQKPHQALNAFKRYTQIARNELGAEPGPEITQLAATIRSRLRSRSARVEPGREVPDGTSCTTAQGGQATPIAYLVDVHTFEKMVTWEERKIERQGTHSSVVVISLVAPAPASETLAGDSEIRSVQPWQQAVLERLRRADVASVSDAFTLALLLPETDADGVERVLDRLRPAMALASSARKASVTLRVLAPGTTPRPVQRALTLR